MEIVIFRTAGAGNPLLFLLLALFRYNRATGTERCTESHERKICDEIQQKIIFPLMAAIILGISVPAFAAQEEGGERGKLCLSQGT